MYRVFLRYVLILSAWLYSGSSLPNVVVILIDDSGYADVTATKTPNIYSIGLNGVSFTDAYVTAPQCSPSRAGLLSGRYQQRFGHESNSEYLVALGDPNCRIIPEYLPIQYSSGMIGKWNLGDFPNPPSGHGFNQTFLYRHCDEAFSEKRAVYLNSTLAIRGREYSTSIMFEKGQEFIYNATSKGENTPFFLYLSPMSPHVPHVFPPSYQPFFDSLSPTLPRSRRRVMTMMQEIDDGVGAILTALRRGNVFDNTLVFFINDNGAPNMPSEEGAVQTDPNFPFRGYKGDTLEGGVRVRFHMQWPDHIRPNQVVSQPVSSLDVLPTIIDAMQQQASHVLTGMGATDIVSTEELDGKSLLPLVQTLGSSAGHHRALRQSSRARCGTTCFSDRMLFWRFGMECRPIKRAIRHQEWKWVQYGSQKHELYNLTSDAHEAHNVAALHPSVTEYYASEFRKWTEKLPPIKNRMKKTHEQCQQILVPHKKYLTKANKNRISFV